jgi:hypothetical protein
LDNFAASGSAGDARVDATGWYWWAGIAAVPPAAALPPQGRLPSRRRGFRGQGEVEGKGERRTGPGAKPEPATPPSQPKPASTAARGHGNIAVGGNATGTFVAGERHRVAAAVGAEPAPPGTIRPHRRPADGRATIAVAGHASGTFVAGTGNKVTVVAGPRARRPRRPTRRPRVRPLRHWRGEASGASLAEAVTAAKAEAARKVDRLKGESGLKDQVIAAKDAAIEALAARAGTGAKGTVTAALERSPEGTRRPPRPSSGEFSRPRARPQPRGRRSARHLGALAYGRNIDEALAAYRRAAELDPGDTWTWIFIARHGGASGSARAGGGGRSSCP